MPATDKLLVGRHLPFQFTFRSHKPNSVWLVGAVSFFSQCVQHQNTTTICELLISAVLVGQQTDSGLKWTPRFRMPRRIVVPQI